jgi:hypothetical protein
VNSERQAVRKIDDTMKGRQLRGQSRWFDELARIGAVAVSLVLALVLVGCDPNEKYYLREGIGTKIYTAETASVTELQNIYLDYLCLQSNSYIGANAPGCPQFVPASDWPLIVQAGLNDIDTRCDSYLAWLDQKKREAPAVLAEIGAIRFAVDALTNPNIAGVSAVGLAAISAAFGLATNTVNNFNMLLLQVDHTTVQNVVIPNRRIFREDLLKLSSSINNKPAAVHTLRSYLSICMPMTIAANINSTVTVFQQTGSVGSNVIPPTLVKAFTPATVVQKPDRPPVVTDPDAAPFFAEKDLSKAETDFTLGGLCIDKNTTTGLSRKQLIKTLVNIFEMVPPDTDNPIKADGVISQSERRLINKQPDCNAAMNYFEKVVLANTQSDAKAKNSADALAAVIEMLKRAPGGNTLAGSPGLDSTDLRNTIRSVRITNGLLDDVPSSMTTQITSTFINGLKAKLKK